MKERRSNIELLRILSILLVLAHHFSIHGGFKILEMSVSVNKVFSLAGKLVLMFLLLFQDIF